MTIPLRLHRLVLHSEAFASINPATASRRLSHSFKYIAFPFWSWVETLHSAFTISVGAGTVTTFPCTQLKQMNVWLIPGGIAWAKRLICLFFLSFVFDSCLCSSSLLYFLR